MNLQRHIPKTASRQKLFRCAFASGVNRPENRAASRVWARRRGKLASGESLYNYFRDYDPNIGRYIESDPIGLRGGLNTYGYTEASPLTHKDEKGLLRVGVGVVILGWFGYELADKYRAEKSCALSCKLQCENIRACGDEERNDALQNNIPRCIASCIPLCVAEFVGGPSKGPTGKAIPQP